MKWSVRKKLIVSFSAIALVLAASGSLGIYQLYQLNRRTEEIGINQLPMLLDLEAVVTGTLFHSLKVDQYVSTGNRAHLRAVTALRENIAERLKRLAKYPLETEDRHYLGDLQEAFRTYLALSDNLQHTFNTDRGGRRLEGKRIRIASLLENALIADSEAMYRKQLSRVRQLVAADRTRGHRYFRLSVISSIALVGIAVLVSVFISRSIILPITKLLETTRTVADGDLSARADESAGGEIGLLAGAFNGMTIRLRELFQKLEERVAEQTSELADERNFISTILDTADALVVVYDTDGRIVRANRACENTIGPAATGKGQYFWDCFSGPGEAETIRQTVARLHEDRRLARFTSPCTDASGRMRRIRWSNAVLEETDAVINLVVATGIDITDREEAIARLRDSEEKYRQLAETAQDIIATIDFEGRVTYINRAGMEISGYTADEIRRCHVTDVIPTQHLDMIKRRLAERIAGDRRIFLYRADFIAKSGQTVPVEVCSTLIRKEEAPAGILVVARDLSERARMEQELLKVRQFESLGYLAGGIAHDFNNLLSVIMGNIEITKIDMMESGLDAESLTAAEAACQRASELTDRFITFSKGGAPVKTSNDLEALLREVAATAPGEENVDCLLSIADDLGGVTFDARQMRHALKNLIANAKEAMPRGGVIQVSAETVEVSGDTGQEGLPLTAGTYVCIRIKDQGIGIANENLHRIFDPYFSTKPLGLQKGLGLGLTTTYSIIQKHGGYLFVDSLPSGGTICSVYLPVRTPEPASAPRIPARPPRTVKGRILFMDDEAMFRTMMKRMLTHLGYDSVLAANSAEAMDAFQYARETGPPFDAVILDLKVRGGLGGVETLSLMKRIQPEVIAIVASGYADDPVIANPDDFGFVRALKKPIRINDLETALAAVLPGDR